MEIRTGRSSTMIQGMGWEKLTKITGVITKRVLNPDRYTQEKLAGVRMMPSS
jgi:hypothetical protein